MRGHLSWRGLLTEMAFDLPRSTFMARLSSGCSSLPTMDSLVYPGRSKGARGGDSVRLGLGYLAEMHTASSNGKYPNTN